jgi:hypothetical protein
MKKLIVILFAAGMLAACGDGAKNRTGANTEENMEDNSGEVAAPIEEDTTYQMESDTLQADSIR